MKISELMIGDWVRCSDPTPFRVQGIYNDDPWMVEDEQGLKVCHGDVEPIPLTEEILVKNGYEYEEEFDHSCFGIGNNYSLFNDECEIEIYFRDSYNTMTSAGTEIFEDSVLYISISSEYGSYESTRLGKSIYVHELQHALRLCGLTELADNFKV